MNRTLLWLLFSHLFAVAVGMWAYAESAPAPTVQVRTVEDCQL